MSNDPELSPPARARRPWRPARIVSLAAVLVLAVLVVAALVLASRISFSSEAARAGIVAVLSHRLDSDVELQDLRLQLLPQLRAEGDGLTIRHKGRRDVPPLISIAHFSATGSLLNLLRRHVTHLTVDGLDIEIPPDRNRAAGDSAADRDRQPPPSPGQRRASINQDAIRTIVVDEMISTDARLVIIPKELGKVPKVWAIAQLRMHNLGVDRAMPFEATLTNAVPPGEINTAGSFGPWHADEPGQTPLDGKFEFDRADLGFFKGISGILSARGTFGGSLARIDALGETDTPAFTVTAGGNPVPLHASYHAIVDGTNGNTILDSVNGSFLNTSLVAKGSVIDAPGESGRVVTLDVTMNSARIEDILKLALKATHPPMTGALRLTTTFVLPRDGDRDVIERLHLDGQFAIADTRFTDPAIQKQINELSRRSKGKTADQNAQQVASQFEGTFTLDGGTLTIPRVTFNVPGALVRLSGTYALAPETIDFNGTVSMDATISQMVTGIKGTLLKVVEPLFKKQGGGTEIPLKIGGRRDKPTFGLDVGRVFSRRSEPSSRR